MSSGAQSILYFSWENATWGSGTEWASATDIPFGYGAKLTTESIENNLERIYGLGSRYPQYLLAKNFAGSYAVEFVLSDPRFLHAVFGDGTATPSATNPTRSGAADRAITAAFEVTGSGKVYSHTFTEASVSQPSFILYNTVTGSTFSQKLDGCIVNSCTISAAVNDVVIVKLDGYYKTKTMAAANSYSQPAVPTALVPMSFAHGHFQFPNDTSITVIQNMEMKINKNNDVIFGLGSRLPAARVEKAVEYEISASVYFQNPAVLHSYAVSGTSTVATAVADPSLPGIYSPYTTLQIAFSNKAGADATNTLSAMLFNFAVSGINSHGMPQSPNEPIIEDCTIYVTTCTPVVLAPAAADSGFDTML